MTRAWPLKPESDVHAQRCVSRQLAFNSLTFGAPVHERLHAPDVLHVHHTTQLVVDPPACLDAVKPANNNVKLHIIIVVLVLNLAAIGCDGDAANSLFHEASCDLGFGLSDVAVAEEELSVEVGDVNGV